ncbi:hypothetical protein [Cronobacter dublinensis]|uniref:hypothetical protein n=1 Tax=Cronobacter dublinensis TaxID=413497 RepID=UPI00300E5933
MALKGKFILSESDFTPFTALWHMVVLNWSRMSTIARSALKGAFFIVLSMLVGRSFDIYSLVSTDTAISLSYKLFGEGGQENVEMAYVIIDTVAIVVLTSFIYVIVRLALSRFMKSSK